ncbi:MAG: hypothetical protein K0M58_09405 [Thiobacillus sp.]|nr:hypothetical protein [Thiobacillus sp.]
MTLAALIRKRESVSPANANPAKAANDGWGEGEPLAGLAALALANPTEAKTDNDATSWCWWLAFSETEHLIVYFHPEATRAEVLERYPGVLVAEPYTPPETTADVLPTDMDRTAAGPYPHWPEAAH